MLLCERVMFCCRCCQCCCIFAVIFGIFATNGYGLTQGITRGVQCTGGADLCEDGSFLESQVIGVPNVFESFDHDDKL